MQILEVLHGVLSIVEFLTTNLLNAEHFEALYLRCLDRVALLILRNISLVSGWSSRWRCFLRSSKMALESCSIFGQNLFCPHRLLWYLYHSVAQWMFYKKKNLTCCYTMWNLTNFSLTFWLKRSNPPHEHLWGYVSVELQKVMKYQTSYYNDQNNCLCGVVSRWICQYVCSSCKSICKAWACFDICNLCNETVDVNGVFIR